MDIIKKLLIIKKFNKFKPLPHSCIKKCIILNEKNIIGNIKLNKVYFRFDEFNKYFIIYFMLSKLLVIYVLTNYVLFIMNIFISENPFKKCSDFSSNNKGNILKTFFHG